MAKRTASSTYEIEDVTAPDKRRHMVKLTVASGFKGAKRYDADKCDFVPLDTEIEITIDPSEFLEFVPLRDIAEQAKDGDLFACYSDADTAAVATIMHSLDAIDSLDVDETLDEIRRLLQSNRADEALLFLDRWQAPKFKSVDVCKSAVEARLARH